MDSDWGTGLVMVKQTAKATAMDWARASEMGKAKDSASVTGSQMARAKGSLQAPR